MVNRMEIPYNRMISAFYTDTSPDPSFNYSCIFHMTTVTMYVQVSIDTTDHGQNVLIAPSMTHL